MLLKILWEKQKGWQFVAYFLMVIYLFNYSYFQGFSRINCVPHNPDFYTTLSKWPVENIMEKEENAGDQHLSFSHNVFNPVNEKKNIIILANFILFSANVFEVDQSRILSFGKELRVLSLLLIDYQIP